MLVLSTKRPTKAQLLEGKANLLRLRQDIPLADAELSAVEDGLTAYEKLLEKLADVPTPAGPTPRQLRRDHLVQLQGANNQHNPTIGNSLAAYNDNLEIPISGNSRLTALSLQRLGPISRTRVHR